MGSQRLVSPTTYHELREEHLGGYIGPLSYRELSHLLYTHLSSFFLWVRALADGMSCHLPCIAGSWGLLT